MLAPLPNVATAPLPVTYEAAKRALAVCDRADECQDWADKAQALASYARQSDDQSLRKMADRIQARAIRRCGELLKQFRPGPGTRIDLEPRVAGHPRTITEFAMDAKLSGHQRKTALRVANVPGNDFETAVESDNPPTVTQLAEQGRKPLLDLGKTKPANFAVATQALAQLRRFAEFTAENDPTTVASGVTKAEAGAARATVAAIDSWLDRFIVSLGD